MGDATSNQPARTDKAQADQQSAKAVNDAAPQNVQDASAPATQKNPGDPIKDQREDRLRRAAESEKSEYRTSDPTSDHYDAALAIDELWPGSVRE